MPGSPPAQRPNTPVPTNPPISPARFYSSNPPPPLPHRPRGVGSSCTSFQTIDEPPTYGSSTGPNAPEYREPESRLVTEDIMIDDGHPTVTQKTSPGWTTPVWDSTLTDPDEYNKTWEPTWSGSDAAWQSNFLASSDRTSSSVPIGNRDDVEELCWWNREANKRPGPGFLAPVLEVHLHNPEHSLLSVSASAPDIAPSIPAPGAERDPAQASSSTQRPAPQRSSHLPPTEEEVRTAVPHPNAYFCPKDNGWILLSWKSSSVPPPLSRSGRKEHTLPDQSFRQKYISCLSPDDNIFGAANKTHHFHRYQNAVDSSQLTPAYRGLDAIDGLKQKRRTGMIIQGELQLIKMQEDEMDQDTDETGTPLDLYVCCQCSFYCVASKIIPAIIPRYSWNHLIENKRSDPLPGKTREHSVATALETMLIALENKLWRLDNRDLRASGTSFRAKVGCNDNVKQIFEALGFVWDECPNDVLLKSPSLDSSAKGRLARAKLLRGWVEIGAWLADYRRINSNAFKDYVSLNTLWVKVNSAREMYQNAIGSHPDQIPRNELSDTIQMTLKSLPGTFWTDLGLTSSTASTGLLEFAYLSQCRCDPIHTLQYFTHLSDAVSEMQNFQTCPQPLEELFAVERSRGRFTRGDVDESVMILGFGSENLLRVEYSENDIDDQFIENAWKARIKESFRMTSGGSDFQREATEALKVLAEMRGSSYLRKCWEASKDSLMTPDRAYQTLEIPQEVDDSMLITVFSMRLEEQPSQLEKMREALLVIAESRDSERLRKFMELGSDPGEITAPTRPDWPRGLNQLGNTCYLNSLLQYFYTIKDLRDAVSTGKKELDDDEKFSDDDLKRHRVGGRLVTRREIVRSKKFVNQLADLFWNLEYADNPAVTPTIELAKLALVTSRDEEEDEVDKGGTDSSNDTDATLVDDGPVRYSTEPPSSPKSPSPSPGSILGKRARDIPRRPSEMDVDTPSYSPREGRSSMSSPRSSDDDSPPPSIPLNYPEASTSGSKDEEDVDMQAVSSSNNPPPLPPRKPVGSPSSEMMFGKQHDVAECMDNCMFQIETALLKFDSMTGSRSDEDKTSVVKRLFYGKIRQNVVAADQTHEKEDLFSHLPVNVSDEGFDIYDGLGRYFYDVVDYKSQKVPMQLSLVSLPPLLHIQLQRVQFDRELCQSWKSQAYVKFGETLYMDRFMDDVDLQKKAQSRIIEDDLNICRERLRTLLQGKNGTFATAMDNTRDFLSQQSSVSLPDVDEEMITMLNEEEASLKAEIDGLHARIQILKAELEAMWENETKVAYELTSVFIHRGSTPTFGHYFFYSRHLPDSPDEWFRYNDSDVSVIPKEEVLADTTGSTANPYLLVYTRKGSEVVDTVKRFDLSTLVEE
ncbi:cysteine proteinase [Guyanagaster necrorhizus]|uniref:ubiquitinyl hydrolase 1 n=1 Tax=Guyanagaster necrorhizus TaxID=856835 RepID=A0A9P8AYC3_9AGAR|nr:cysteine proteinase [Guyanagaster necrorhizus MCA 3950]KAG7452076.1 cysteine proteinase [Guyanagaster necrorhizus MCA 3950]